MDVQQIADTIDYRYKFRYYIDSDDYNRNRFQSHPVDEAGLDDEIAYSNRYLKDYPYGRVQIVDLESDTVISDRKGSEYAQ